MQYRDEQLISTIYEQSILLVDDNMAEDLIVSCCTEANNSADECQMNPEVQKWTSTSDNSEANNSADECQMNPDVQKWTSTSDNFARLALHFHIFFYSMQHMPLWRSKFRMRIKTIRTKKGTLRISHTSSKLPQDIRSGSFDHKDQLEENGSYY